TDGSGLQASCSQTVSVIDINAPVLTPPNDKVVAAGIPWSFDLPLARESGAVEELVYDNGTNDLTQAFETGAVEVGDVVTLGGLGRVLSRLSFNYWGTNSDQTNFAGSVSAR